MSIDLIDDVDSPTLPTTPDDTPLIGEGAVNRLAHRLLTAEEEVDLAARIEVGLYAEHLLETDTKTKTKATEDELRWLVADGQEAYYEFIHTNLRLVLSQARKFRNRGVSEADIEQDGYAGLIKGIQRYDYAKGFRFSTYGVWWIREGILAGIRSSGFVKHPENLYNLMMKVRAVRMRVTAETGTEPTAAQIAAELDIEEKDVIRCARAERPVSSLHTPLADGLTLGDLISDPAATDTLISVEEKIDHDHLVGALGSAISRLSERDIEILRLRFGLDGNGPRTIVATAEILGLTRQTVRMREQQALRALRRHPLSIRELRPFSTEE